MKKVLFISNRTSFSGGEVVLLRLIENDKDIDPVVAAPNGELLTRSQDLKIPTHILNEVSQLNRSANKLWMLQAFTRFFQGQAKVYKIIKKESPDIVHANALGAAIYSSIPSMLSGKSFFWTSHNIYRPGSLNMFAVRFVSLFSSKIIAVSRAVQDNLVIAGVPKNKTQVIYNGLDLPTKESSDPSLRQQFNLAKNTKIVALIAAITPWKGQETLIDAAAEVTKKYPDTTFLIVGAVEDQAYYHRLTEKVETLNLSKSILFAGFLKEIPTLYPQIDILVNASATPEPFGTTIYEAMLHGVIPVGSKLGGTPEIITDHETGFLFKPRDARDLATKLSYILSQSDKLDDIRSAARREVATRFNIDQMVTGYNNLYESL